MDKKNKLALIVGFYLSKFDRDAYENLGYKNQSSAHTDIGKKLRVKPTTLKNMRDEFDPYHDNPRKGWWQSEPKPSRLIVKNKFENYSEVELRKIVEKILNKNSLPKDISEIFLEEDWSEKELEMAVDVLVRILDKEKKKPDSPTRQAVLNKLNILDNALANIEKPKTPGIGHNNPPEPIEKSFLKIGVARQSIANIKKELESKKPNKDKLEKNRRIILKLGIKLAIWAGNFTKKVGRTAETAVVGAIGLGVGNLILDAMKALSQFLLSLS